MSNKLPGWMTVPLPDYISNLSHDEGMRHFERFESLTNERHIDPVIMPWPKQTLCTRAILDGFNLSAENEVALNSLFDDLSPSGVIVWATYDKKMGFFKAKYDQRLLDWIDRELIVSPVSLISIDSDVILIMDETFTFTLIGTTNTLIEKVESYFGDGETMKTNFIQSLTQDYSDDNADYLWIKSNVLPWCQWT